MRFEHDTEKDELADLVFIVAAVVAVVALGLFAAVRFL